MNNAKVQDVGQKLVDPSEKLRRESAERKKEQRERQPKVATVLDKSISAKSDWESKSEESDPMSSRNFGKTLISNGKNSGDAVPAPTDFESDINHDPRERSSGRKLRKV